MEEEEYYVNLLRYEGCWLWDLWNHRCIYFVKDVLEEEILFKQLLFAPNIAWLPREGEREYGAQKNVFDSLCVCACIGSKLMGFLHRGYYTTWRFRVQITTKTSAIMRPYRPLSRGGHV